MTSKSGGLGGRAGWCRGARGQEWLDCGDVAMSPGKLRDFMAFSQQKKGDRNGIEGEFNGKT